MSEFFSDVRYALRALRATPLLTMAVVLTLALGIGANAAIFTVVNATLLAPLPYDDPERLVLIWETHLGDEGTTTVAPANYIDWRDQSDSLEDLAAFNVSRATLTGDGDAVTVEASVITPNFFDVLGVEAELGTTHLAEQSLADIDDVILISNGLWRSRYGADPEIVGRTVIVGGRPRVVVGVMPAAYRHPERSAFTGAQVWVPMTFPDPQRNSRFLRTLGRLAPGYSHDDAVGELDTISARLEGEYPDSNAGYGALVVRLRDDLVGSTRDSLVLLLGAAAVLLLIVCTNVANLLLARGQQRRKEMAIRAAVGAGRGRLIRQVLIEGGVLTVAGTVLGVGLVVAVTNVLTSIQAQLYPSIPEVGVDVRVLGFAIVAGAVTALLFGAAPAAEMSGVRLATVMGEDTAGGGIGKGPRRTRAALVVAEVALATVLLIGAGLLSRSFLQLQSVPTGFDARGVVSFRIAIPETRYQEYESVVGFFDELRRRITNVPGVVEVGVFSDLPFTGSNWGIDYLPAGAAELPPSQLPVAEYHVVGPGTFAALGIPLLTGRAFDQTEGLEDPLVVVVNRTLAEREWSWQDAVGQRLRLGSSPDADTATIIGVVGDTLDDGYHDVAGARMFISNRQWPNRSTAVVVRTEAVPSSVMPLLRRELAAIDADLPMAELRELDELLAGTVSTRRLGLVLLNTFTALAVLLASLGIYGVMAYGVARRSREIAIRGALGARRADVVRMVVIESMSLAGAGIALGIAGGLVLGRMIAAFLFAVQPADPLTFVVAPLLLAAVALAASIVPARRAAKLDPMAALRGL